MLKVQNKYKLEIRAPHHITKKKMGVFFDLDGVIIDSEHLMRLALKYAYNREVGNGDPPYEEYFKHMGEYFPVIMEKMGLPVSMWQPYMEFSTQNLEEVKIFSGIVEQLDKLSHIENIQLGLITGKDRKRTIHILKHFGIYSYFKIIVTPEMVKRAKPFPDGLLYAAEFLECRPEDSLYIGDALNDIIAANRANMTSIIADWGARVNLDKMKRLANFRIKEPGGILHFVQNYIL